MFGELITPITKEKEASNWWKKFRILSNCVLVFFLAISVVGFLSIRLNLEMALSDPAKREYFSGLAFCISVSIPWFWNFVFTKIKENHLQALKKTRVMQTKRASITIALSLLGVLLLGNLALFVDFSLYAGNYEKRQKSTKNIQGMPLGK